MQRRLDGAYLLTLLLLGAGGYLFIAERFDYEEAVLLAAVFAALLPCRGHFYRKAALLSQPFTFRWITAITLVLSTNAWLIFFSYKHVAYSHELWWQFAFNAEAPRSLRSMVGVVTVVGFFALAPLWSRTGAFVFRHGEHFYNFQGLRRYKEKFHPDWKPRYLAVPGRVLLLPVLVDLAALISGGIRGVVAK